MKKFMTFLIILSLPIVNSFAQTNYKLFEFYEGYIIKNDGTKERGFIQYIDETERYEKVFFRTTMKDTKQKFSAKDIKGYKLADQIYHSVEYKGILGKEIRFLALESEGCISQYFFRQLSQGALQTQSILAKKDNAISTEIFITKYAQKMADFISDNPALSKKVADKEKGYGLLNLYGIVKEYNEQCVPTP